MSEKKNQAAMVLDYMKRHGSIDPVRAMNELRIMRLGARIWDLKANGIPIVTEIKTHTAPDGSRTHWAEYRLGENAS